MENETLIKAAFLAREKSYAPYSGFHVGAALLTKAGNVYAGCNIENAAFTPTNCAERTAIFKAVSEGEKEFVKIAIVGGAMGKRMEYCPPCGVCRQVMREFVSPQEFVIVLAKSVEEYKEYTLKELFPESFGADNL